MHVFDFRARERGPDEIFVCSDHQGHEMLLSYLDKGRLILRFFSGDSFHLQMRRG